MRKFLKIEIIAKYDTQRAFCLVIRKPVDWLSKVIHGQIDPSSEDKKLIADALGIKDAEYLFQDWEKQNAV